MEIKEKNLQEDKPTSTAEQPKTATELKRESFKKTFAKFNKNNIEGNDDFLRKASQAINDVIHDDALPTKKYLEQVFERGASDSLYEKTINAIFSPYDNVPYGQGVEYELTNGMTVGDLDYSKFIPEDRNDPENYTYWTWADINPAIKQVKITLSPVKYYEYFLSGKVDEYVNLVADRARASMFLEQYKTGFNLIKDMSDKVLSNQACSPDNITTNHIKGKADYLLDALKELRNVIFEMKNHNKTFAYDATKFTGYNNLLEDDWRLVTTNEVFNTLKANALTFLNKNNDLEMFADLEKWVVLPKKMFDTSTGQLNNFNFFGGKKGVIFIVSKSGLKRLTNLSNTFSEFYPNNLTTVQWFNWRYGVKALPWTQCAIYENEALEQGFYIPTAGKAN